MENHRPVVVMPMKDHQHVTKVVSADDLLRNLIEHQDRSVPSCLVNDLEAQGIAEHGLDPCECVEDLRDPKRLWAFELVLCSEALGRQALLHVGRREERVGRVHGVLTCSVSIGKFQRIVKIVPRGSGEVSDGARV